MAVEDLTVLCQNFNPRASRTVPFVSKAIGVPLADIAARWKLADIGFTQEVIPAYSSVKEAVFPFVKFPGAEVSLTPEMKSTGEVMSIDEDPAIAYFKSQVAAGVPLTTMLDGFRAAARALAEEGSIGGTGVRTLQEYHFSSATKL